MAWRRRGVAAVASGVLLVAGCGDDGRAGAARSTTSVEAERATAATTAATATTTTATVPAIEPPANTGTDMVAILQSLSDFGNRLGMAPDPELVGFAYQPGTPLYESIRQITQDLVDRGWRWTGPTEELRDIKDTGPIGSRSWTLTAVSIPLDDAQLVQLDGTPVATQPRRLPSQRFVIQLVLGEDERWRIADIQPLGPPIEQ